MSRTVMIVGALVLLALIAGAVLLATASMPAPVTQIEKPLPDDRLPK